MKKFLSMALALVMTLSLCAVVTAPKADAGFADADELSSQYAVQAADVIQAIEVMDGYSDGTFRPEAGLTRQAAAKIICNMILGPTTARALPTNARPFPDVLPSATGEDNQFAGYISYCAQQGIISGYGDGTFRPGDPLSGYAYLKMLLGALGYDAKHEGFVGDNWKVNVAKIALGIGLNKGIEEDLDGATQVNREAAAIYAFNTIQSDMVEYESKNTLEINGVTVSMGGGNAVPQTWNTSSTSANNINDRTSDGNNRRPIVQFAERYFDKLEREPKQWDTYTEDDFGRPSIKWTWKGVDVGTYSRDPDVTFVGGVKVNEIYEALRENAGMTSGSSTASLYVNSSEANRGWKQTVAGVTDYTGNPGGVPFKVERANDKDLADEIFKTANTKWTASGNDNTGGRPTGVPGAGNRNVDRIGDGTLIEVFRNDATNHIDVCVISVYAGKVDAVKAATTKKDAYVTLSLPMPAFRDQYPDSIMDAVGNREFETEEFEEDDIVAFTYSDSAEEIKSMYLMTAEAGTLQSKVTGKSLRLDDVTYSYGKSYVFDDLTEDRLGTKSSYIVYLDENDYVLWVEEDEFSVEDYVLIERISIETTSSAASGSVKTTTASVLGGGVELDSSVGTLGTENDATHQYAYKQSKAPLGNSTWDARARLRYPSGAVRTLTLDDSKNYRTDATGDIQAGATIAGTGVTATADSSKLQDVSGDGDGNWIAEPFTAGHIVRLSSNSNGYRLHSINSSRFIAVSDFRIEKNQIGAGRTAFGNITHNGQVVRADSETHFVIDDTVQNSYKSYVGNKNVPDVAIVSTTDSSRNAVAYIYHSGTTAKLIFVTSAGDVTNSSSDIVFLAANSVSNLVESDDGEYYEITAVDKNEVKTLMIKKNVVFTVNGLTFDPSGTASTPGIDKEGLGMVLNNVSYDSNDFITKGSFPATSKDSTYRVQGIRRVNSEEVRLDTSNTAGSRLMDIAENIRVFFVDGDDISQIDYSEIVNDTLDYVYVVENDDGEVSYLFIVDYDGGGNVGGAPTPANYAIDITTNVAAPYTVNLIPATAPLSITTGTKLDFQVMNGLIAQSNTQVSVNLSYRTSAGSYAAPTPATYNGDGTWSVTIPVGTDIQGGEIIQFVVT